MLYFLMAGDFKVAHAARLQVDRANRMVVRIGDVQLSTGIRDPGWFVELGRFVSRLKATPEPGGEGNMLDNTAVFFGSASSAFHLSRNYPLLLFGGRNMGFKHGQYLKYNKTNQATSGIANDSGWQAEMRDTELPLSNLYLAMLHKLGVETDSFGGSTEPLSEV